LVLKGVAEVTNQGEKSIVKAGEASYVLKDQPPSSAICAPLEIFMDWEVNYRESADAPALGKVVSELPQEPCSTPNLELPSDAHILYEDDFTNPSSGWLQVKIDNSVVGYFGGEYYQVQILNPNFRNPVYVPNKSKYEDVNIDLKVLTQAARDGDFHYGLVFRRSGDQYYAFTISPHTKKWYVLKSSSDALNILKEGTNEGIQGLDAVDILRVSTKGSTFFFRINGLLVYQVSDPDYDSGEVGLFVQTRDSSNVLVQFDSITIWNIQPPFIDPTPGARELCFNNRDDDGDGLIDKADDDCDSSDELAPTALPTEPPTSEPPTSEPPTSEPPTSEPPTSEPPTSEPPTSEPPTSEPPTSEPPPPEATPPPAATQPPVVP
jgi:hypothetical protein